MKTAVDCLVRLFASIPLLVWSCSDDVRFGVQAVASIPLVVCSCSGVVRCASMKSADYCLVHLFASIP